MYAASYFDSEPPVLAVGTEVSAKYKGAFCEARIKKVARLVKCRVSFKSAGSSVVTDDNIKGNLRVGAHIEAKHPDKNVYLDGVINKIIDASQYTVVFDDADEATLRRTSLCLKSGKHFAESESLDHLPLTNPEHFGNPVNLGMRGRRSRRRFMGGMNSSSASYSSFVSDAEDNESAEGDLLQTESLSIDDDDSASNLTQQSGSVGNTKDEFCEQEVQRDPDWGKVVCVEYGDKRGAKAKDVWFPALIVSPVSNENSSFDFKDEYMVKSFKDNRFYQVAKKDAKEFSKEFATTALSDASNSQSLKTAVEKALNYIQKDELPSNWDYDILLGNVPPIVDNDTSLVSSEYDSDEDFEENDNEPSEEKDRFVAQLYKYMDERGTPINKAPSVASRELDFYKLYRLVTKMGGYNRVTNRNSWKTVYSKMGLPTISDTSGDNPSINQLKLAYKRYLHSFDDFYRKLGCTMAMSSRSSGRLARSERTWRGVDNKDRESLPAKTRRKRGVPAEPEKKDDDIVDEHVEKSEKSEKSEKTENSVAPEEEEKVTLPSRKNKPKASKGKPGRKKATKPTPNEGDNESFTCENGGGDRSMGFDDNSDSDGEDFNAKTPTISKDELVNVGDKIKVKYGKGKQLKVYEAKILKEDKETEYLKKRYYVHYTGWNIRYDEWIMRNRIVGVVRDKSPKRRGGNKQKNKGVPINVETGECNEPAAKESKDTKDTSTVVVKRGRPQSANAAKQNESAKNAIRDSGRKEAKLSLVSTKRAKIKLETQDSVEKSSSSDRPPNIAAEQESAVIIVESNSSVETKVKIDVPETVVKNAEKSSVSDEQNISNKTEEIVDKSSCEDEAKNKATNEKPFDDKLLTCSESLDKSPPPKLSQFDESNTDCESHEDDKPAKKYEKSVDDLLVKQESVEDEQTDEKSYKIMKRRRKEMPRKEKKRVQEKTKEFLPKKKKLRKKDEDEASVSEEVKEKGRPGKKKKKVANVETDDVGWNEIQDSGGTEAKQPKRKRSVSNVKSKMYETVAKSEASADVKSESFSLPKKRSKKENEESKKKNTDMKDAEEEVNLEIASIFEDLPPKVYPSTVEKNSSNEINNEGTAFLLCKEEVPASPVQVTDHNNESSNGSKSQVASVSSSSASETETAVICPRSQPSSCDEKDTKECSIDAAAVDCPQFTPPTTPDSLKSSSVNSLTPPHENLDNERHTSQFNTQHIMHGSSSNSEGEQSDISTKAATMSPTTNTHHSRPDTLPNALSINSPANHSDDSCSRHAPTDNSSTKKGDIGSPSIISPLTSPKKKRRGRTRTSSTSDLANKDSRTISHKTRVYAGRRTRQQIEASDTYSNDANGTLSPIVSSINLSNYSPNAFVYSVTPTSKYNFCTPINENLEADKRIQILSERLQELKRTYLSIKAEVASIERRRKKAKKKERDRNSPQTSPHADKHLTNDERTSKLNDDTCLKQSQTLSTTTTQESVTNGPSIDSPRSDQT